MAERIQVELVDDIDGSEAQYTVTFALDGVTYEIDLSEQNARGLRGVFKPYIERARTASKEASKQASKEDSKEASKEKPRTSKRQEREERQARRANRQLTEEIRGAARRSRERYQQDREDEAPQQPDTEQRADAQDSVLEQPVALAEEAETSGPEGAPSLEDKPVPAVSLPQFSSAGE